MSLEEVIDLDPLAQHFYGAKESNLYNAKPTNIYIPPFEFLIANVGYGTGTTRVATCMLSIKMNVTHGKLLHEMLLQMANNKTNNPVLKYVPVGTAYTIGLESYKQLILANNAYLTLLASIPVVGISDDTLKRTIPIQQPLHDNQRCIAPEQMVC